MILYENELKEKEIQKQMIVKPFKHDRETITNLSKNKVDKLREWQEIDVQLRQK